MSTLDHLVWAVPALGDASERLRAEHGLLAHAGGMHPAWGTRNAIVPLGGSYLELVEVADPDAPPVGFTRRILDVVAAGGGAALWSERVDDIDTAAGTLGYDVVPGTRLNPDGSVLSWRVAGMPQACATPTTPFLIQWDDPAAMPGLLPVAHPCGQVRGARVEMGPLGPEALVVTTASGDHPVRRLT